MDLIRPRAQAKLVTRPLGETQVIDKPKAFDAGGATQSS